MGKIWAIGNAKDIPNKAFWRKFSKLYVSDGNIMQWDIIVRILGDYGHVAIVDRIIWDEVYVLEQNWSWKNSWNGIWQNAIRINYYKRTWFQTILRNDSIVANFNMEMSHVDNMIEERQRQLNITIDYKECLRS